MFDLDGTLVDSAQDLASGVNAMLARLQPGRPPLPLATVQSFIGNGARTLVSRVLGHLGQEITLDEALPLFLAEYRLRLLETTRLYPGMRELLEGLRGQAALAVLTNKPGEMSRAILTGLQVAPLFFRIQGGDVPDRKPDPAGLIRLMQEAGANPASTTMVGDSGIDVRTARAAGVEAVGVSWGFDPEGLRAEPPDLLVSSVEALAHRLQAA